MNTDTDTKQAYRKKYVSEDTGFVAPIALVASVMTFPLIISAVLMNRVTAVHVALFLILLALILVGRIFGYGSNRPRKPVTWLEFGPDGITSFELKQTIPWNAIRDISRVRNVRSNSAWGLLLLVASDLVTIDHAFIWNIGTGHQKSFWVRIQLNKIYGVTPDQVYKDALLAFSHYSDAEATNTVPQRLRDVELEFQLRNEWDSTGWDIEH